MQVICVPLFWCCTCGPGEKTLHTSWTFSSFSLNAVFDVSVALGCVGGWVCHGKSMGGVSENNPRKLILTFPLCRSQVSRFG